MSSMTLDAAACEWFKLRLTTEPATTPTDWEASNDGGDTWTVAHSVEGIIDGQTVALSGWLVAGPDYDGASDVDFTVAVGITKFTVRLIDNPETVIRYADKVTCKSL